MSKTNDFFKDAIAEAKQIRNTALNVAKLSLEESLAPKIQSMISEKLNEMEEKELSEGEEINEESLEEVVDSLDESQELEESQLEESEEVNENSLEEEAIEEEAEGDDEVGEITVDDLKSIIADVFAEMQGGGDEELEGEEELEIGAEEEEEMVAEEDLSELNVDAPVSAENPIIKAIDSAVKKSPELAKKISAKLADLGSAAGAAMRNEELEESKELEEARKTITSLTKTLKEVNLLNAKLLYVNKIFKANNLTEGQKVKVVKSFDKAETVKDTQTVYNTLHEAFKKTTTSKRNLKENLGRASKPLGNSTKPKEVLNENANGDAFINRMQKLAGIK